MKKFYAIVAAAALTLSASAATRQMAVKFDGTAQKTELKKSDKKLVANRQINETAQLRRAPGGGTITTPEIYPIAGAALLDNTYWLDDKMTQSINEIMEFSIEKGAKTNEYIVNDFCADAFGKPSEPLNAKVAMLQFSDGSEAKSFQIAGDQKIFSDFNAKFSDGSTATVDLYIALIGDKSIYTDDITFEIYKDILYFVYDPTQIEVGFYFELSGNYYTMGYSLYAPKIYPCNGVMSALEYDSEAKDFLPAEYNVASYFYQENNQVYMETYNFGGYPNAIDMVPNADLTQFTATNQSLMDAAMWYTNGKGNMYLDNQPDDATGTDFIWTADITADENNYSVVATAADNISYAINDSDDPQWGGTWSAWAGVTITYNFNFFGEEVGGISAVAADNSKAAVEYFNLQGQRVANPAAGQMVIRRQGTEVSKLIMK